MQYDISNYDYILFVDASGDDGFKFDKDSSKCYTVAAVLVPIQYIEQNIQVLQEIKQCIGAKPTDELKYSKLRRNKKYKEVIEILSKVKCNLYTHTAIKEILPEHDREEYTKKKMLSQLTHIFPIETTAHIFSMYEKPKVLIAIDVMKKVEMDGVNQLIDYCVEKNNINFKPDVIFRDSKDSNFKLIQLADILSGFTRNFIEQLFAEKRLAIACKPCFKTKRVVITKRNNVKCATKKNIKFNGDKEKSYFNKLIKLFGKDQNGCILLEGLSFSPPESYMDFLYIDCIFNRDSIM